jgi:hypothetical protein
MIPKLPLSIKYEEMRLDKRKAPPHKMKLQSKINSSKK